ncbi:putative phage tail protein [uncultured Oscillibacter sp.]|uniref:putative phage tail protein n=1 Tax=uncultured Oscillibacter sp. TaxID=876091 RepID=UPI0025D2F873|nr:putative phage tail protein [uncultured Oscillibacter sp.]
MRPFLGRYPAFLQRSPEFRDLQQALEPELLELWAARDSALEQLCVETASWGLRYWEQTLGLPAEEGKDLEVRRSRVRSRLMGADVTTVSLLESVAGIYAKLPAKVEEHPERFWVDLLFDEAGGIPGDLEGLVEALREIMPAHLGWGFRFSLELEGDLRLGGAFGMQMTLPVPEVPDRMLWLSTLRAGGLAASSSILPVPEQI